MTSLNAATLRNPSDATAFFASSNNAFLKSAAARSFFSMYSKASPLRNSAFTFFGDKRNASSQSIITALISHSCLLHSARFVSSVARASSWSAPDSALSAARSFNPLPYHRMASSYAPARYASFPDWTRRWRN
eukprot:31107-Pelagococcus_subviridis.AAC.14